MNVTDLEDESAPKRPEAPLTPEMGSTKRVVFAMDGGRRGSTDGTATAVGGSILRNSSSFINPDSPKRAQAPSQEAAPTSPELGMSDLRLKRAQAPSQEAAPTSPELGMSELRLDGKKSESPLLEPTKPAALRPLASLGDEDIVARHARMGSVNGMGEKLRPLASLKLTALPPTELLNKPPGMIPLPLTSLLSFFLFLKL